MGRVSRRIGKEKSAVTDAVAVVDNGQVRIFPTAIYVRLSVENSGKDDDGAAIENQIAVCKEYVAECPDLQLVRVYQDNGWTGTVMKRPAFDEMMEEVKRGRIRAIVVRDLSRFGRNYIETGTYLERIFPRLDVRFISVKERFDTFRTDGSSESLMIPLQNLINDLYSKDISRKVEAALHGQMEEGTFAWRQIPYGYRWNEGHTNIVPDEVTAPFVRKIFEWTAEGVSKRVIAERLDKMGAPRYFAKEGDTGKRWAKSTIHGILMNQAYVGKRVYGCRHSAIYRGIRLEKMPEESWYVTENAHEALVSEELFQKVREKNRDNSGKRKKSMEETAAERAKIVNLFEKKVFCGDCGYRMYFHKARMDCKDRHWYAEYYCSSSQTRKHLGCSCHRITQKALEEKVFEAVRTHIGLALDYEGMMKKLKEERYVDGMKKSLDQTVTRLSSRVKAVQGKRTKLYEDYVGGLLDEAEYVYAKNSFEKEFEELNSELEAVMEKRAEFTEALSPENRWLRLMESVRDAEGMSKELADAVVEQVKVYEHGVIEIVMKYQDIFELTGKYLEEIRKKRGIDDEGFRQDKYEK